MEITKLQMKRESMNLSIEELAQKSFRDCGNLEHMILTIKSIESGLMLYPRPRKTYEWKYLAKALKCSIEDIY